MNFNEEAEKLCKELGVPNKVYKIYLANKLEMAYTQGKLSIIQEFKKMEPRAVK